MTAFATQVLNAVATDLENGLPVKSIWSDIHRRSYELVAWPDTPLREPFEALALVFDITPRGIGDYLGPLIRKTERSQLIDMVWQAARSAA